MNREIKFRAWSYASKVMFYPDSEDGWEIKNGILYSLPNTILMQYTGLKDKNGLTDIYEFDLVEKNKKIYLISWSVNKYILTSISNGDIMELDNNLIIKGNYYENSKKFNIKYPKIS